MECACVWGGEGLSGWLRVRFGGGMGRENRRTPDGVEVKLPSSPH